VRLRSIDEQSIAFFVGKEDCWKSAHAHASRESEVFFEALLRAVFIICFKRSDFQTTVNCGLFQMFPARNVFLLQKDHFSEPPHENQCLVFVLQLCSFECNGWRIGGVKWIFQPYVAVDRHLIVGACLLPMLCNAGRTIHISASVTSPALQ